MLRIAAVIAALGVVQTGTGSVAGRITDSSGGAIPGVTITALFVTERTAVVSNSDGRFRLDGLPPGRYELQARLAGFETEIEGNVAIAAGATLEWNRTLRVRFAQSDQSPASADPMPPAVARPIFEAVLREIYKGTVPAQPVIETVSVVPSRPDARDWETALLGAPAELRTKLEVAENRQPVWLNAASLPPGTRLVSRDALSEVFRSAPTADLNSGWDRFRARYGVTSYVALSRALVTDDGRDALVFFRHACGSLCGEGTLLWLRRFPADGPWTVRARRVFYVS
jgi:hypothetical protein